jgi:hypothetical protein
LIVEANIPVCRQQGKRTLFRPDRPSPAGLPRQITEKSRNSVRVGLILDSLIT